MQDVTALQTQSLSHHILQAQEEERKRISRELHDVIAQTLVGINLHLRALSQEATVDPDGLRRKIARTQRLVQKSVDVVHRFARELRPTSLDTLGLVPALRGYLNELEERSGLECRLTASSAVDRFDVSTRTVLFRIAQEALSNVVQHARASVVVVALERTAQTIRMTIVDDGCGFDAGPSVPSGGGERLGLVGMRERAEMVGGTIRIDSGVGRGTTVRVDLPTVAATLLD